MNIKKNDTVIVLSGKDKGKKGKVMQTMPASGKVLIEGVNMGARHQRPRKQGDQGGIIRKELPIYACKVMRICPKCNKPTRAAYTVVNGEKSRVCKKCGQTI